MKLGRQCGIISDFFFSKKKKKRGGQGSKSPKSFFLGLAGSQANNAPEQTSFQQLGG